MALNMIYPPYEVVRNLDRCTNCRVCERQCANGVHRYDAALKKMVADESQCVNCHRCVALCPTRALKIVKTDHTFRENGNTPLKPMKTGAATPFATFTARPRRAAYCSPPWATPRRTPSTGISS